MEAPLPRALIHPKKNLSRMGKKKIQKLTPMLVVMMTMITSPAIFCLKMKRRRSWIRSLLQEKVHL
jgi:hypothetical protein